MKICSKCGVAKDLSEFYGHSSCVSGVRSSCKQCVNEDNRGRYKKNPKKVCRKTAEWQLKNRFRISLLNSQSSSRNRGGKPCSATEEQLAASFSGVCEICGKLEEDNGKNLSMDHCHKTGNFRGWLCSRCNSFIGYTRDSITILRNAIAYLQKEKKETDDGPLSGQQEFNF